MSFVLAVDTCGHLSALCVRAQPYRVATAKCIRFSGFDAKIVTRRGCLLAVGYSDGGVDIYSRPVDEFVRKRVRGCAAECECVRRVGCAVD
jgi:hypothetical protein